MNDRILNLILNVQYNAGNAFEKVKQQLSGFASSAQNLLLQVNNMLQVMSNTWVKVNSNIALVAIGLFGLHKAIPIIEHIGAGAFHFLKILASLVVTIHIVRVSFQEAINWIIEHLRKLVGLLQEMGVITGKEAYKIAEMLQKMKNADPFPHLQKSAEKFAKTMRGIRNENEAPRKGFAQFLLGSQRVVNAEGETIQEGKGGILPGITSMLGQLLNPKVSAMLLLVVAGIELIKKTAEVAHKVVKGWLDFTISSLMKIIELAAGVGTALTAAFVVALKKGIEVSSQFEQMQVQMENVIKTSRRAGTVTDVKGEAREQMRKAREIAKEMPTVSEQDIIASVVQTQVLGTMDRLVAGIKTGGGKKKLFKIIGDAAAQFQTTPQDITEFLSRGALGIFRGGRFGITREKAESAGAGDTTAGMLSLLEKNTKGAMNRVRNTYDGALAEIHKIWDEQFKDMVDDAFHKSIEPFVLSLRDTLKNLFDENKEPWKSAKNTISKIFKYFSDIGGMGIIESIRRVGEAIMKFIASKAVSDFIDNVHLALQVMAVGATILVDKLTQLAEKYMPSITDGFDKLLEIVTTVFFLVIDNLPKIIAFGKTVANTLIKIWAFVGDTIISVGYLIYDKMDTLILKPLQSILILIRNAKRFVLQHGLGLEDEDKKGLQAGIDEMNKFNNSIENNRKAIFNNANAFKVFVHTLWTAKDPLNAIGEATRKAAEAAGSNANKEAKDLINGIKAKNEAAKRLQKEQAKTEDKSDNKSVGAIPKLTEDNLRTMVGLLNEMGNGQQALNVLSSNFNMLVGSARKNIEIALHDMKYAENQDIFDIAFGKFVDNINKLRDSAKATMDAINGLVNSVKRIQDAQMGFVDSIDRPMGAFYDQMVKKQQDFIQVEKTAAQFQMNFAMQIGDLNMYSDAYERYLALLRQEIDLRDKQIERMFKYKKEGYDAIKGLIDAQKSYIEVLTSDQGPMADFQAKRQLMMEQLDVLKAQLAMQEEQLKIKERQQEEEGGIYDKIVQQKTEIIKTKTEMMGIEKTLRNIANPSLLEQIVGAPQRVLAMLPSAKQLHDRARTAITEQMGGVQRTGGGFTILQVPQGMGMLPGMGTGGMVPNQLLGTKFFPYHTAFDPMKGLPGRGDIKDMINRVNTDQTNLPNRMPVPQVNMSIAPIVNVAITSLGQQWAQISPMIYQMIVRAINQQQRDQSRYGNSMAPTQPYVNNTPPPAGFNPGAYGPGSTDTPTNSSRAPTYNWNSGGASGSIREVTNSGRGPSYHSTNAGGMGGNGTVGVPNSDNGIPRLGQ